MFRTVYFRIFHESFTNNYLKKIYRKRYHLTSPTKLLTHRYHGTKLCIIHLLQFKGTTSEEFPQDNRIFSILKSRVKRGRCDGNRLSQSYRIQYDTNSYKGLESLNSLFQKKNKDIQVYDINLVKKGGLESLNSLCQKKKERGRYTGRSQPFVRLVQWKEILGPTTLWVKVLVKSRAPSSFPSKLPRVVSLIHRKGFLQCTVKSV